MWYLIGISIITLGILVSCNFNTKTGNTNELNDIHEQHILMANPLDTINPVFSLKDIEFKLKRLAETPPPEDLAFGAKCYKVAFAPETASYVCPVCGKKTLHKVKDESINRNKIELIQWGISACRHEMLKIKGINIALNESQFCKACSPDIIEPELCLSVHINDATDTTTVCNIDYLDIRLLAEFLNDELKHKSDNDSESPLVNHIERIQKLMGVNLIKTTDE